MATTLAGLDGMTTLVAPRLGGKIPQATLLTAMAEAARAWCEETEEWREWADAGQAQAGITEYAITIPEGYGVTPCGLLGVKVAGRELHENQVMQRWGLTADGKLSTREMPISGATLTALVAWAPVIRTAAQIPAWMLARHKAAIAAKTRAILERMRGKPWSDPQGASVDEDEYAREATACKIAILHRGTQGSTPRPARRFL